MTKVCAIHQPNFLPRLSTLTKLLSADVWVVLDDVQFARRDYQHRARLAQLHDATSRRWLSLSTCLPEGRSTSIRDARLVDSQRCARQVDGVLRQYYGRSKHWPEMRDALRAVVKEISAATYLHEVTAMSTRVLLDLCGWRGEVLRSSDLDARTGRSERLADLTRSAGADVYLCGMGGARYLDIEPFEASGLTVDYFREPRWCPSDLWRDGRDVSAVWTLAGHGCTALKRDGI